MTAPRHLRPGYRPRTTPTPRGAVIARKKPVTVCAIYWDGANTTNDVLNFAGTRIENGEELLNFNPLASPQPQLWVAANGAKIPIQPGTWILRDRLGLYPCHPDIFTETYEILP